MFDLLTPKEAQAFAPPGHCRAAGTVPSGRPRRALEAVAVVSSAEVAVEGRVA